ncbi:MAG: DUF3131 domain-containing protein [Deltaproteobacteria bacterium]|nr:DUF3131 domain-containing protein [Deltaproteobacteria bacterium]
MKAAPPTRSRRRILHEPDASRVSASGRKTPPLSADAFSIAHATTPGVGSSSPVLQKLKEAEARPYLAQAAREQWQYYADHVNADTNFLPPDNIRVESGLPLVVDPRTSPTNIGLYLLSTVTAKELGLIGEEEALTRLRQTVETIKKLPKHTGTVTDETGEQHAIEHLYNWYGIQGQPTEIGAGFISTVDNGNFVAFLIAVVTAIGDADPALKKDLLGMIEKMRFDVFYDRVEGLLYHGAYAKDGKLNFTAGHYDMLITEARCAYATAIMLEQIPKTAWTNLKRKLGKEVDNLNINRALDFQSYTGTMFEYLTPRLLMKHQGTPLGVADEQAVKIQMADSAGGIWGRSEANSNTSKGYAAWGSPALSQSKEFTTTGDDIIAPYASQMATVLAPVEVADNLRRMEALGLRGKYGFYESAAVKKDKVEVVPQFYAHHIGMGFVGMANHLCNDVVTDWFHGSPLNKNQALEGLLSTPVEQYAKPGTKKIKGRELTNPYAYEAQISYDKDEIVGNSRFVAHAVPVGGSTWTSQHHALSHNESFYLRDNLTGALLPVPIGEPRAIRTKNGTRSFDYEVPYPGGDPIRLSVEVSASAESAVKVSRVKIDNQTGRDLDLAITGTLDWILDDINAYLNHPVYRNLYVETKLDEGTGIITARRRTAQGAEQDRQPFGFFAVGGRDGATVDWADGSRTSVLGRLGSLAAPRAVLEGASPGQFGFSLDPAAALSKSIRIPRGKQGEVSFLSGYSDRPEEIARLVRQERLGTKTSKKAGVPHYPPDPSHAKMLELAKRTRRELRIMGRSAAGVEASPEQAGHWSKDGRTFIIDHPFALKKPWSMVASNGSFGFVATAAGWAYSFGTNSQQNRITPYVPDNTSETPLRGVLVTDRATGERWSIAPNPAPADGTQYSVEMSPGQIKYLCRRADGLSLSLTMSVAAKDPLEVWKIEVENGSGKAVDLELSSFLKWALGANHPSTESQTSVRYDEHTGAIYASSTDSIHQGSVAFHVVTSDDQTPGKRNDLFGAPDDPFSGLSLDLKVAPGGKRSIAFALGQAESADAASKLVDKVRSVAGVNEMVAARAAEIDQTLESLQVSTPDASLNAMLNTWLPYQAYHAHFLARSGYYQSGGAYGFRDQLQTVMNLLDSGNPIFHAAARSHLLESSRHQFEKGHVQHWWHPHNNLGQQSTISDNLLWLPYALEHYLEVTGDDSILKELTPFSVASRELKPGELDFVEAMRFSESKVSLYDHAKRAIDLVIGERLGKVENGGHGLPLIGKGDWNDGLDRVGHLGKGESVWLGFFLFDVLTKFAGVAEKNADPDTAKRYRAEAAQLKANLKEHGWDAGQFLRAYADSGEKIDFNDAIVQAWAVLSGGADRDQAIAAVRSAVESLYKPDDKIILLFDRVLDKEPWGGSLAAYPNGLRENNAQYTHGSSWLPRAVAELGDGDLAMELYQSLLPTTHASDPRYGAEPYVVAADIYGGAKAGEGGWTWYSGGPSWIYRTGVEKILGVQFKGGDLLFIDPTIPTKWPGYQVEHRRGNSRYRIEVKNPDGVSRGVKKILLDGKPVDPKAGITLVDDQRPHAIEVLMGATAERPSFELLPAERPQPARRPERSSSGSRRGSRPMKPR